MNISFTVSSIEQDLYRKMKKKSVFELFNNNSSFSTKSFKKTTIYDYDIYSLLQLIILKMSINTAMECKVSAGTISTTFFLFGSQFNGWPKVLRTGIIGKFFFK